MAYKWAFPSDWLKDKWDSGELTDDDLWAFLSNIMDEDQVQDYWQDQMDADGYFEPESEDDEDE